jgi:hypothetical protein
MQASPVARLIRFFAVGALTALVLFSGIMLSWRYLTLTPLDLWWIWESRAEALQTMSRYMGGSVSTYLKLLILFILISRLFWLLWGAFLWSALLSGLLITILSQAAGAHITPISEMKALIERNIIDQSTPLLYSPLLSTQTGAATLDFSASISRQPIVVIQMESANGLILQRPQRNPNIERLRLEHTMILEQWAKRGLVIDRLWSTSVQTNRAYESLYCGIARNLGGAMSFRRTVPQPCVPTILSRFGYRPIFINNYHDSSFQNFEHFASLMGFNQYLDSRLLVGGRNSGDWGADECVFADSVVEWLGNQDVSGPPLFLNVKFSPNHVPFCRSDPNCSRQPIEERFLRSSIRQLTCVEKFERDLRLIFKAHQIEPTVLILSDTSWPIGLSEYSSSFNERGISVDGFLSYAAILPPRRGPSFPSIEKVKSFGPLSQLDIGPTILDLAQIPGRKTINSWLPIMQYGSLSSSYEACHILSQPFGEIEFGVVTPNQITVYNLMRREAATRFLKEGIFESKLRVSTSAPLNIRPTIDRFCERFEIFRPAS